MTKRECAIVMAYTGTCMLTGYELQYFYQYIEKIMGRPIYTHELLKFEKEIQQRSYNDFINLCRNAE